MGAPNSLNLNCKVRVMKETPDPSVSEEIADIFTNYNIDNASKKLFAISFAHDWNFTNNWCSFDVNMKVIFNGAQLSNNTTERLENVQIWLGIDILSLNTIKIISFYHNQCKICHYIPVITLKGQKIEKLNTWYEMGMSRKCLIRYQVHLISSLNHKDTYQLIYYALHMILSHLQYAVHSLGFNASRLFNNKKEQFSSNHNILKY